MLQGWISVHRQIQEHWLWADKPFSKGQAWIDMLMLANHEDKQILLGKEVVTIKTGSFITSEVKLAERWGWSRHKVRDFLDVLKTEKMIDKVSDRQRTTIFVDNYAEYQDTGKYQKDNPGTTQGQPRDTNNNDNNANNTLSYPLFCARTRESFSKFDVGLIDAKLMRKGVFVSGEEIEKMLTEFGKAETLKFYGLE